jgi:hypothetical protein
MGPEAAGLHFTAFAGWRPCVSTTGKSLAMKYCCPIGQDAEGFWSHSGKHSNGSGTCEQSLQGKARSELMTDGLVNSEVSWRNGRLDRS